VSVGHKKIKGQGREKSSTRRNAKGTEVSQAEKTETPPTREPADFAEVRKNIATLVRMSANAIAAAFVEAAKKGQVAPEKYLFEAVGLYPPTAETLSNSENSLAYTLLKRIGLPTEPVICEEDLPPAATRAAGPATRGAGAREENWEDDNWENKVSVIRKPSESNESQGLARRHEDSEDAVE